MTEGTYLADRVRARCIEDADCWVWQGFKQAGVMPMINNGGKIMAVRRALFLETHAEVAKGCEVVPTCETRHCVNPDHIAQITVKRRRQQIAKRRNEQPVSAAMIARNRSMFAKLDIEKARAIRASEEGSGVLAERYGVSRTRINSVRNGSAWQESSPFAGLFQGARG
jgi:hypothetical protein